MNRSSRLLAAASLVGAVATLLACGNNLSLFGAPTQTTSTGAPKVSPTPTPTPTQSPTPTPSPTPCDPEKLPPPAEGECHISFNELRPFELTVPDKGTGRLSLTPYQTRLDCDKRVVQVEVSESCNRPRASRIVWQSSSPSCTIGTGFEPILTRSGTGTCTVTATLEGVPSNQVIVR